MANKEMYDYLSDVTADYTSTTLSINPQKVFTEIGEKRTAINIGDDGSEERIALSNTSEFYITLGWDNYASESDSGTIFDFYNDSSKANGNARSIQLDLTNVDGHTYVVRFDGPIKRERAPGGVYRIKEVRMKVLGY